MCSSPEFQRKVKTFSNNLTYNNPRLSAQAPVPSFFEIQSKKSICCMFKLLDTVNDKVDLGVRQQPDYETCYQTIKEQLYNTM